MIYVLADTVGEVERWRGRVLLPRKVVEPLTRAHMCRGRRLTNRDVIMLPGFLESPYRRQIERAIVPCGVRLSQIPLVPVR